MYLKDIYPNFKSENKYFECKTKLNEDKPLNWLKTVVGFANAKGGTMFIGVEPEDYRLIGLSDHDLDKEKMLFYQNIKNHIPVHIDIISEIIAYSNNDRSLNILKLTIIESNVKPVILMYDNMPLTFVRRDGFTSPATYEELRTMVLKSVETSYDMQRSDALFNINDFKQLNAFFCVRTKETLNEKHLGALGFFDENKKLRMGAYLFKDNIKLNNTKIVCSLYSSNTRGSNYVLASNTYVGNLIGGYHFIKEFVETKMNHGFLKLEDSRIDIDGFPTRALFEAIINALAHRDYYIENSQISVDLFPNRLCITSPGSLFGETELKPTYNLRSFLSKRRNPLICDIFAYCKAMEAKGTGFEKIEDDYKQYDVKHRPFIFSKNNQFSIILPDLTNPQGVKIEEESLVVNNGILNASKYDLDILAYCYDESHSISEIAKHIGVANSMYLRNNIIKNLSSQNFLLESSEENKKIYTTNKDLVKLN